MDFRTFIEPQQGTSYDAVLALARASEQAGMSGFFTSDHYLRMGGVDGLPGPLDAWTTLAGLARDTDTIRLGTLVTPTTFRGPGSFAIQAAQVDHMSGGRVEIGLGAGWYEAEHAATGAEFPSVEDRFDRLEDTAAILTGMWATPVGELFSYSGAHFEIVDSPALPKPAQVPGPPIIIGGKGKTRTPRLAATIGAEFNLPFSSVEDWSQVVENVKQSCTEHGRDPNELVYSAAQTVCIGRDEAEFVARAERIGRDPAELRENAAAGLPNEAVARLERFGAAGCQRVYLQCLDIDDLDHMDLIAAEIIGAI
ncbi:MAG: LLM class F420-dependent oxidoreductase [Acidimicrobiia bacterium]